ncbi:UxaA family hydrolase [Sphingomonas sp. NFR15]|uniref:UxaA family hydrolase n=1 Tax=Sphingomonas sp. NFR15 TaxID=1566282 RepID=UPI0008920EFD|nr:altronate dehydratase family protein [Sphingomonas sp. NFR15]SDA33997.1 altronate hydrolase [Sphingomonas sp. NFR15]
MRAIKVDPRDDVAVAMEALPAGDLVTVGGVDVRLAEDIPAGHKFAVTPVTAGRPVLRYGFPIGTARADIAPGAHVHTHNVATALATAGAYRYAPVAAAPAAAPSARTFEGYLRADGSVGTRNEIWIIPSVGCVGRTAERLAARAGGDLPAGVDGVVAFPHPFGCSQLGDDLAGTTRVLAALACHPNAGGVLLLGLGCESNQLSGMLELIPPERRDRIRVVGAQASADEMAEGLAAIAELVALAARDRRSTVPLSALTLGVKCGGSDGLSGLTANPVIGRIADRVGDAGGRVLLTEIPEIFGAEQLLMDRCTSRETFDALVSLVNGFKDYFVRNGEPVSENPSPGNIRGGITTLEEKSLGAVQKGGHVPVTDVLPYAGRVRRAGLTLLEAPGNDAVSTTALAAAGATMTLFSTGRGTPLGSPVPTVKIASNAALAAAKPGWIDFDAGAVLDDGLDVAADRLLDRIVAIASGARTRNEVNEERAIAIWKRGVTL